MSTCLKDFGKAIRRRQPRVALLAVVSVGLSACAQPTLFNVDTTEDLSDANVGDGVCAAANGLCSLRAAVQEANAAPSGSNFDIRLLTTGPYEIAWSQGPGNGILIHATAKRVRIVGCCPSTGASVIEPDSNTRHFTVLGGAVIFQRLTLRGGKGPDAGEEGLRFGGAIHVAGVGTRIEVLQSILENNNAGQEGRGGAIFVANDPEVQLLVSQSILRNNTATSGGAGGGGGIWSHGATFISESLFEANDGNAGAIRIEPGSAAVPHEILRSTFRLNSSSNQGGGGGIRAHLGSSTLHIARSTFSHNETTAAAGGAAIHASSGNVHLTSSTLTGNSALNNVHALRVSGGAQVVLHNTLIDANPSSTSTQTEIGCDAASSLTINGHNFIDGMSEDCAYLDVGEGNTIGFANSLDADLGSYQPSPLGHHPLRPGSPAVDHGPLVCASPDQIGNPRPVGVRCDTGAIELP